MPLATHVSYVAYVLKRACLFLWRKLWTSQSNMWCKNNRLHVLIWSLASEKCNSKIKNNIFSEAEKRDNFLSWHLAPCTPLSQASFTCFIFAWNKPKCQVLSVYLKYTIRPLNMVVVLEESCATRKRSTKRWATVLCQNHVWKKLVSYCQVPIVLVCKYECSNRQGQFCAFAKLFAIKSLNSDHTVRHTLQIASLSA